MLLKIVLLLLVGLFSVCFTEFIETPDKTYFVSKEALNWTDAKNACTEAGLELVSILNENEQDIIETFLKENHLVPADKWSGYWLAGIRLPNNTFYWDTTGTEIPQNVNEWARGEPSNGYQKEQCIELKLDDVVNRLGWNDYFCAEERKYLCQTPRKEGSGGLKLEDYSFLNEETDSEDREEHLIVPFGRLFVKNQTSFV